VITGGSDGSIVRLQLKNNGSFPTDVTEEALQPNHNGQVAFKNPNPEPETRKRPETRNPKS
jgi:hypothetical protein